MANTPTGSRILQVRTFGGDSDPTIRVTGIMRPSDGPRAGPNLNH
jgi:hypothetical protein